MFFDLQGSDRNNVSVDVDNTTRSGEMVFQGNKGAKSEVVTTVDTWMRLQSHTTSVKSNTDRQYDTKTHHLNT